MEQDNRIHYGWEDSDSEQEQQAAPSTTPSLPGEPYAGTHHEIEAHPVASFQPSEAMQATTDDLPLCMICLDGLCWYLYLEVLYHVQIWKKGN